MWSRREGDVVKLTWKYPRGKGVCEICGSRTKGGHFAFAEEAPHLGWCWNAPSLPNPGWKTTRNPRVFIKESEAPKTRQPTEIKEKEKQSLASPVILDQVYKELVRKQPLSGIHHKQILDRGFSSEQLQGLPLGSLTSGSRYGLTKEIIANFHKNPISEGVPGFYRRHKKGDPQRSWWTLGGRPGLLIPVFDLNKRLIRFQIRSDSQHLPSRRSDLSGDHQKDHYGDHQKDRYGDLRDHQKDHYGDHQKDHHGDHQKDHHGDQGQVQKQEQQDKEPPKYVWLSSTNREGGAASGSPAGILYPEGTDRHTHFEEVFFTEGFFKALALVCFFRVPVVWIAGVHQYRNALDVLSQLRTKKVCIVYDADFRTNASVQGALLQTINAFRHALDARIEAVGWEPSLGKGIDDAILQGGLEASGLFVIDTDQILSEIRPPGKLPNSGFLRLHEEAALEPPPEPDVPTQMERWKATDRALQEAFETPLGTITLITAGTGDGKSTALCKHVPSKTLVCVRDYDDTGEQMRKDLLQAGKEVHWIYGRQLPVESLPEEAPDSRKQRSQTAYCTEYNRAVRAVVSGHNACLDCQRCPVKEQHGTGPTGFTGKTLYGCHYRKHRDWLRETPPSISLAIPQVALQKNVLQTYENLVFDDIPQLLQELSGHRVLTQEDIRLWQRKCDGMPEEVGTCFALLQEAFGENLEEGYREVSASLRASAEQAHTSIEAMDSPLACEQPFQEGGRKRYPKAFVRELLSALAEGMPTLLCYSKKELFTAQGEPVHLLQKELHYWTGHPDSLRMLENKRVVILNATPDLTLWKELFGNSPSSRLRVPSLPKAAPRIIQIPDILGKKEQILRLSPHIRELAEQEEAFVLTRLGECVEELHADGWMGRHERGLNHFKDYKAGIIAGHLSLPSLESKRMAQGVRALAFRLGLHEPRVPVVERDEKGKAWKSYYDRSNRYRGIQRYTAVHEDSLAEHINRHFHTSAVLQGWGRNRGPKLLYLIDGMPLYSPRLESEPIWVTIMTLEELGLCSLETRGNPHIQRFNEAKQQQRQERIERFAEESYRELLAIHSVVTLQELPNLEELREWLGKREGVLPRRDVVREVRQKLIAILQESQQESQELFAESIFDEPLAALDEPSTSPVDGFLTGSLQRENGIEENQVDSGVVPDRSDNSGYRFIRELSDHPPYHSPNPLNQETFSLRF